MIRQSKRDVLVRGRYSAVRADESGQSMEPEVTRTGIVRKYDFDTSLSTPNDRISRTDHSSPESTTQIQDLGVPGRTLTLRVENECSRAQSDIDVQEFLSNTVDNVKNIKSLKDVGNLWKDYVDNMRTR